MRRLQAFILTAVLLIGGSGLSALDLSLYHLGQSAAEVSSHRVSGTNAQRPHADSCALLDWSARGPYALSLSAPPLPAADPSQERAQPAPSDAPHVSTLHIASRPRAPPVPLV
jgi:hypothetical protein